MRKTVPRSMELKLFPTRYLSQAAQEEAVLAVDQVKLSWRMFIFYGVVSHIPMITHGSISTTKLNGQEN